MPGEEDKANGTTTSPAEDDTKGSEAVVPAEAAAGPAEEGATDAKGENKGKEGDEKVTGAGGDEKKVESSSGTGQQQASGNVTTTLDKEDPDYVLKKRIFDAFDPFDNERNATCDEREVRSIMRYLGAFPTEGDLSNYIMTEIKEDEDTRVKYDRFEEFMLKVMKERKYLPDDQETLLQAFKVMDPNETGLIDEDTMVEALTSNDFPFHDKEVEDFLSVARDTATGKINYVQYVTAMSSGIV